MCINTRGVIKLERKLSKREVDYQFEIEECYSFLNWVFWYSVLVKEFFFFLCGSLTFVLKFIAPHVRYLHLVRTPMHNRILECL